MRLLEQALFLFASFLCVRCTGIVSHWDQIPGALTWISGGAAGVWGVNRGGAVFRWDQVDICSATSFTGEWNGKPGNNARISAGPQNHVWMVTHQDAILFRDSIDGDWTQVDGSLMHISVHAGMIGSVWGISRNGQLWRREGITAANPMGTQWKVIDNGFSTVSTGPSGVWATTPAHTIQYRTGTGFGAPFSDGTGWQQVPGFLSQISSGKNRVCGTRNGILFCITGNSSDALTVGLWERQPGTLHMVSNDYIRTCKCLLAIGNSDTIWRSDDNGCFTDPCQNGGTCADTLCSYTCDCSPGYEGLICDEDVNECLAEPCQNNGTCTNTVGSFSCACNPAYNGSTCDELSTVFTPEPGEAALFYPGSSTEYHHWCSSVSCDGNGAAAAFCSLSGYGDPVGSYNAFHLTSAARPAKNFDGIGVYVGYAGVFNRIECSNDVNECLAEPCLNDGSCTNTWGSFRCTCTPGYIGSICSEDVNECLTTPCQNAGSCTNTVGSFTCSCIPGYMGSICDEDVNECLTSPCQNGGSCTNTVGSFTCACTSGYTGSICNEDVDECLTTPCQNAGSCTNTVGSFTCSCIPGYMGSICDEDVNECLTSPCQNGGFCTNTVGSFTCACTPGYTGSTCNEDVDECLTTPCQNAGSCTNTVGSFTCACIPGYTSSICDEDVNECLTNLCQNNGSCTNTVGSFLCACISGYTSLICDEDVNECLTAPCQNGGSCKNTIGSFTCTCRSGYNGSVCDEDVNECLTTPCQNGGTCKNTVGSFTCLCTSDYMGSLCENNAETEFCLSPVEKAVAVTMHSCGSLYSIIIILLVIFVFQILLREKRFERLVHLGEEICLVVAYLIFLVFQKKPNSDIHCKLIAASLEFLFTALLLFMLIEAIQVYCIRTSVVSRGGFISIVTVYSICFGVSAILTGIIFLNFGNEYVSDCSCVVNINKNIVKVYFMPMLACGCAAVVLSEAAGMECKRQTLAAASHTQWTINGINRLSLPFLVVLSGVAIVMMAVTLHYQRLALYFIVFGINITLAMCILQFHALSSHKFRKRTGQIINWVRNRIGLHMSHYLR